MTESSASKFSSDFGLTGRLEPPHLIGNRLGCNLWRAHHLLSLTQQRYSYNAHLHIRLSEVLYFLKADKGPTTCA